MKVSFNAFVVEIRRHFRKYTPQQQSGILFRISVAVSVFSLVLIGTGIFIDQFYAEDPFDTQIYDTEFTYRAPGISVGHRGLKLTFPDCDTRETAERLESIMFDSKGVSFEQMAQGPLGFDEVFDSFVSPSSDTVTKHYFGNFALFSRLGWTAQIFSYAAFGLQFLSLVILVWSRAPPASFMTSRPILDQSSGQRLWGLTHHSLTFFATICLFIDLSLVSVYMDLVVGRVVALGFELCNSTPGLEELPLMQFYGRFLTQQTNLDGMTGDLFKLAMTLTVLQAVFVFFLGTDQVRSETNTSSYSLPASKVRQLPWFASIWRFPISLLLLLLALVAYAVSCLYTRDRGYLLNIFTWNTVTSAKTGSESTYSGAFSDFFIDIFSSSFYIGKSLPRAVTSTCLCLVFALAVGSTDPTRFLSKVTQLIGFLILLQSLTSISSLVPTPSSPLSAPVCYSPPPTGGWTLGRFFTNSRCNHLMFSMDAALITLSMVIVLNYIRYGSTSTNRFAAYLSVLVFTAAFILLPIAARISYSMDVCIGAYFSGILAFSQSTAFKMLFRFELSSDELEVGVTKLIVKPAEILNDKVIPIMLECIRRLELYRMAASNLPGLAMDPNELDEIKVLYKELGKAVITAKAAKPLEPMSSSGAIRPNNQVDPSVQANTPSDAEISDMIAMMVHQEGQQQTPVPMGIIPARETGSSSASKQPEAPHG